MREKLYLRNFAEKKVGEKMYGEIMRKNYVLLNNVAVLTVNFRYNV